MTSHMMKSGVKVANPFAGSIRELPLSSAVLLRSTDSFTVCSYS